MYERAFSFIDLFAGAGGLSEGFVSQGSFRPIAHVEMKADACDTLKTRTCYYYLRENDRLAQYELYLRGELSKEELYSLVPYELLHTVINREIEDSSVDSIFFEIDEAIKNGQRARVDLIIGGPPCQAYSLVGRAVDANGMRNDPRNYLYLQYVRFLERYKPNVFVFENVPGILNANRGETFKEIRNSFSESGYEVGYRVLDSADYGVLQHRKRVIIVGWKKESGMCYPKFNETRYSAVVNDLFSDLAQLSGGTEDNRYIQEPSTYLRNSGIRCNTDILTQHLCRRNNDRDVEIYRRVISAWEAGHVRLKYANLPEHLKTRKNQTSFPDRYKVVAGDLPFSHTMIAHIGKDGHYFIHPDSAQGRSISVREAARIQSFPDNYFFEGSRLAKFTQIGNAVPPLLARSIADGIFELLNGGTQNGG